METLISVTELARNLTDYINRVVYRGERFRVTRGRRTVAELHPLPTGRSLADLPDLLHSLPHLPADDVRAFASDIDRSRESLPGIDTRDPWGY